MKDKNIIITREKINKEDIPKDKNIFSKLSKINIITLPVIYTVPIVASEIFMAIEKIESGFYDYLIFLSSNAVEIFFDFLGNKTDKLEKLNIISIGPKTKRTIEEKNLKSTLVSNSFQYSSSEIVDYLEDLDKNITEKPLEANKKKIRVLIPRSLESLKSNNYITKQYNNIILEQIFLYESKEFDKVTESVEWMKFKRLDKDQENYIIFTSPSSVRAFFNIIKNKNILDMVENLDENEILIKKGIRKIISIGPKTSQELHGRKIKYIESRIHTINGALTSLCMSY